MYMFKLGRISHTDFYQGAVICKREKIGSINLYDLQHHTICNNEELEVLQRERYFQANYLIASTDLQPLQGGRFREQVP
jgi:hypothetical protein